MICPWLGGLDCRGSTIALTNNTFAQNIGKAALYVSGVATMIHNNFVNNSAGAITCLGDSLVFGNTIKGNAGIGINLNIPYCYVPNLSVSYSYAITENTITGNIGTGINSYGYGLYNNAFVTITRNTIVDTTGIGINMGMRCHSAGRDIGVPVIINGNTVVGNSGPGIVVADGVNTISSNTVGGNNGGGIIASGTPIITGNLVLQNQSATANGAGIQATGDTIKLYNNVVAGNTAASGYKGGGIYLTPSVRLELVNNTVTGNSAGNGGGVAIAITGVTELLYAYNNILWGNTASGNGADVWLVGTGSRKEFFNNDVHGMYGVWDIAQNGLDIAPLFYDPVNSDYHLRGGSACIDAGTNALALLPGTDLDGNPRIANSLVDMGAYEFFNTSTHPADTNTNWQIESAEFNAYAAAWKADQPWASNSIPADYLTRAGYLKAKGGAYTNDGSALPLNWKPR